MNKMIKLLLKIVASIVILVVVVLSTAAVMLNTQSVQQKLADYAIEQLELTLDTRVKLDHLSVNVLTRKFKLEGLEVEDQQHRKMLELNRLYVDIDLLKLLSNKLEVEGVLLEGVKARLYKPKDGPANYQFIVDTFKKDPKKKKVDKPKEPKKKSTMTFDINQVSLKDIGLTLNDTNKVSLQSISYKKSLLGNHSGKLENLQGQWGVVKKKGPQTLTFKIGTINYDEKNTVHHFKIGDLHFTSDNHKPRKNATRPKRGFFDVGHLDITAQMDLTVDYISDDSINAVVNHMEARDSVTGFNLKEVHFAAGILKDRIDLRHIMVQQETTVLKFDSATVVLPSKKQGRKFAFQTSRISGTTQLRDISRPFAPVLRNFSMPLKLDVLFSGNDSSLYFKDVHVFTPDNRLLISAEGRILHLKEKEKLDVGFHVKDMKAHQGVAIDVINQFTGKKLMLNQLNALGTIHFTGDVSVLYKKEIFKGLVTSDVGNLRFDFAIDELTKYITGHVDSKRLRLNKVVQVPKLEDVGANASFEVDIHKQRTAMIRKKNGGGKLPIGVVHATIYEAGYDGFRLKNMKVEIVSNGAQAEGSINHSQKALEWDCNFVVSDLDKKSSVKIKPKVKLKLGNVFKSWFGSGGDKKKDADNKEASKKEESKKNDTAKKGEDASEKPKKEGFFKRLFKKKDKDKKGE